MAMLEMDDHLQAINIEEQWTMAKTIEGLEEILLDNPKLDQMTRIGTRACPLIRQALTTIFKEN